jgi:outer membrane lipoprotein carrier protein
LAACYTGGVTSFRLPYRLIALMFLSCAAVSLVAQTAPQAAPVARLLEAKYRDVTTLKAAFLQTYRDGRSGVQVESGTVYFGRSGRMRWEYESPETKLFVADGKTVWFFVPADHTVTRSPIKESDDWRTPLALLAGKAKLSQLCERINVSATPVVPSGHTVLECIPRGTKAPKSSSAGDSIHEGILSPAPYDRVLLEVDSSSGELADVRIMQQDGVELEFRFGQWQQNVPIEPGKFQFQLPDGVTVLDESRQQ